MGKKSNGDTDAFPGTEKGMTLREYIAALALQGILASERFSGGYLEINAAQAAVKAADALLVALEGVPEVSERSA